jgi:hypothetical protein
MDSGKPGEIWKEDLMRDGSESELKLLALNLINVEHQMEAIISQEV